MARGNNRPKSMSGKLFQSRYKGLASQGWDTFGIFVCGGETHENPVFNGKPGKSTTRVASLPFLDGACLAAIGGIKETTHGIGWVSVLYDTRLQELCCSWSAHAADTAQPAQVASLNYEGDVTRFDTPITSTGENAEAMDGAVEASLFTVLLVSAIYDVIEKGETAGMSARFLLKSWAEFTALLPDDFGIDFPKITAPVWKMDADVTQVKDKLVRLTDAAWVHLAYHDSSDIYTDREAKPFKSEIDAALFKLNRPQDDLAGFIRDADFLNGLAVRAGFKDVRLS